MFTLLKKSSDTKARLGTVKTDHGIIETPIFMPVGTVATVKAVYQHELKEKIKAQIILGNTYHLYLRPGNEIMQKAGGLHQVMNWDGPILTDSGGYQVFSLSENRKLEEKGATFKSHIDGSKHQFTPENVIGTQRVLGSDIMMVLDECPPYPCDETYARNSMHLTHRWAKRCKVELERTEPLYGHHQHLFGIVQGSVYAGLRAESAKAIADLDFDGNAIGGLSVGEPTDMMYEMANLVTDILPETKSRYLMGVGTPANLLHNVALGIDMFDCVMPTRNARNGMIFTRNGKINLRNSKWKDCFDSADAGFGSDLCENHTLAYLHHLFKCGELMGMQLASVHNLTFYLWLMQEIRTHIKNDTFGGWYEDMARRVDKRL